MRANRDCIQATFMTFLTFSPHITPSSFFISKFLSIAVSRLFNVLDTLTVWTAYFSAWIVPVDEAITYFRVKFEPLRYIFVSLLRGLAPLGDAVRLIVVSTSQMLLPMASRMGIVVRVR